ncbi:MAG: family 10 glycosylhydrolase, partial [Myxococcota bacterium]|nr:family 10 glycosylhydrolase [Myxococcota bacterium]
MRPRIRRHPAASGALGALGALLGLLACGGPEAPDGAPGVSAPPPLESAEPDPGRAAPAPEPAAVPRRAAGARRGLWVLCEGSQRVLEHPERVDWLLDDAAALGVTDLFVQVYRGGRAWFDSTLADTGPYRATFRRGDRDALRVLVARAHDRGLRVHAWVNVLSLASHDDARILQELGPAAAVVDQKGRSILDYPGFEVPPPDRAWYRMGTPAVWLDPAAPGVAERLRATFVELVRRYPELDGLHLDYVRYADVLPFTPGTRFGVGLSFGFGEASRARFRAETGLEAPFGASLANGDRFDDWRRAKLGELVAGVAEGVRGARPGIEVSAAVIADRERAYLVDFQDWAGWLDAGWLDFAVPMLYTRDT